MGGNEAMPCCILRIVPVALALFFMAATPAKPGDPEIDRLLQSPVGKDWVTNGGNLTNQRYSTLKQIDTSNVKQLKGAWMTRLKGSGFGGKYSLEATPLVKDGVMYMTTGNDDVFALNAKTGEFLWSAGQVSTKSSPASAAVGTIAVWRWAREWCSSASSTPMSWRSTPRPARRCGRHRSKSGRTATGSPARRCIMMASSTAGSPAVNMACAAA